MAFATQTRSGRWRGGYRDAAGKSRWVKGTFPRKNQAIAAAGAAEAEARAPGWRDKSASTRPYEDWCLEWWGSRMVADSTLKKDITRVNRHILPRWAGVRLCDITRRDVIDWAHDLAAETSGKVDDFGDTMTLSNATVLNLVHIFSASLSAAVAEGILDYNPALRLKLPPPAEAVERYLTHDEYAAIRAQLPTEHDQLIADLLVKTGGRFGELAGAHVHRLNPLQRTLLVVETWNADVGVIWPYPKGKRVRDVPVPQDEIDRLLELERARTCGQRHHKGRCQSGLLLPSRRAGDPLNVNWWGDRIWKPAVKAAGVAHCRVHDLRHTYASWLIQAGFELAEVGKLLGHVSPVTTQRYAHLRQADHSRVMAALPVNAPPAGFEPATKSLEGFCSVQLSYGG
jgi:integrase